MILQIDQRLRAQIQKSGCYFMSLLYLVNKYTNLALSTSRINSLYTEAVQRGFMDMNCYVADPTGLCAWLGWAAVYTGKHEAPDYVCKPGEVEILRYEHPKYGAHFVVGDGKGGVAYDPYGVSASVREGVLKSKRIFRT